MVTLFPPVRSESQPPMFSSPPPDPLYDRDDLLGRLATLLERIALELLPTTELFILVRSLESLSLPSEIAPHLPNLRLVR